MSHGGVRANCGKRKKKGIFFGVNNKNEAAEVHPGSKNRRLSKKSRGRHKERKRDPQISVLDTVLREAVIKQEIDTLTTPTPAVHVQEPAETASQHTEADLLREELAPKINSENRRLLSVLLYVQFDLEMTKQRKSHRMGKEGDRYVASYGTRPTWGGA